MLQAFLANSKCMGWSQGAFFRVKQFKRGDNSKVFLHHKPEILFMCVLEQRSPQSRLKYIVLDMSLNLFEPSRFRGKTVYPQYRKSSGSFGPRPRENGQGWLHSTSLFCGHRASPDRDGYYVWWRRLKNARPHNCLSLGYPSGIQLFFPGPGPQLYIKTIGPPTMAHGPGKQDFITVSYS